MSASAAGAALAWLIISLHKRTHGTRFWPWMFGYFTFNLVFTIIDAVLGGMK